jgi:hypothetical protein
MAVTKIAKSFSGPVMNHLRHTHETVNRCLEPPSQATFSTVQLTFSVASLTPFIRSSARPLGTKESLQGTPDNPHWPRWIIFSLPGGHAPDQHKPFRCAAGSLLYSTHLRGLSIGGLYHNFAGSI